MQDGTSDLKVPTTKTHPILFIANPDLVERLATGAPLADVDWKTVYASRPREYTDYPTYQPQDNHESRPAKENTSRRLSKP